MYRAPCGGGRGKEEPLSTAGREEDAAGAVGEAAGARGEAADGADEASRHELTKMPHHCYYGLHATQQWSQASQRAGRVPTP